MSTPDQNQPPYPFNSPLDTTQEMFWDQMRETGEANQAMHTINDHQTETREDTRQQLPQIRE